MKMATFKKVVFCVESQGPHFKSQDAHPKSQDPLLKSCIILHFLAILNLNSASVEHMIERANKKVVPRK